MRKYLIYLILASLTGCQKTEEEPGPDGGSGGGGSKNSVMNLAEYAPSTVSAAPFAYFTTNRKGSAFLASVYSSTGRVTTYAGSGGKWEKLGEFTPYSAAVAENGNIIYFESQGVIKRYKGSGAPVAITNFRNFNYSKVYAGHDDKMYVFADSKVWSTADGGETFTATDIPQNKFVYNAQYPVAFFAFPGKMYSFSAGQTDMSTDGGRTWQRQPLTPNHSNSGTVTQYAKVTQDLDGNVYVQGSAGVTVINMPNQTSRSIAFQTANLKAFEQFANFTSDDQGNIYGSINSLGYDYENLKSGGAIYKFSGGSWQRMSPPSAFTGFNAMPVYFTQAGILSPANGVMSQGLYSMDASGKLTVVGAPETVENEVLSIAPHSAGKVFAVVKHGHNNNLNPLYPVLMVYEGGQWKHTGLASNQAFVSSAGDIYSIFNVNASISKDGGATWNTTAMAVDDPLNLRNFLSAEGLHITELKGEIHLYVKTNFGGVGGAYSNYAWTKAPAGTTTFAKILPQPSQYRPDSKQIPLVTASKGTTGFFYKPFNKFEYYAAFKEDVLFTKDGGVTYTPTQYPLPFAGSNSGYFLAFGVGGFSLSSPTAPENFSKIEIKAGNTELDMNQNGGANYFRSWARFGYDNKFYVLVKNKIYVGDRSF